ncbi:MAG TPA: dihydrodipicolinate synthase family protein [Tepidisphaeraceae bacterium]|jgi:N-acetylneuraminate lyase
MKHYTGLIPAAYTPCRADGELNLEPIPELARLYAEQRAPAVFVCGSTGECHSFTREERMRTAEAWLAAAAGMDVIVHVGTNCQRDAIALAQHAKAIGAAAVAALAPSYHRPATVADLVEFMRPVAAAAAPLPFYFYDIPQMTGVALPADRVLRQCAAVIPTSAGIKFSGPDLMRLQACLGIENGRYDLLYGSDENLLAALALGVRGAVGSTFNYAAPVYHRVVDAFSRGDLAAARAEQRKSVAHVEVLFEHGVLRTGKAIMSLIGIDCGPIRPPFRPVEAEDLRAIYDKLSPHGEIFARQLRLPSGG